MWRNACKLAAVTLLVSSGITQAQPLRPPQAKSAISTERDFDRPGGTYRHSDLPLGVGGAMFNAGEQCKIGCYNDAQCRAYSIHRMNGAGRCEMKNTPSKPVFRKGYVSGRRIPPVRTGGNGENGPPAEADPVFGVATCRRLELKCPGPSELAVVKGSCVCQVKRLNTPIEIGPDRR